MKPIPKERRESIMAKMSGPGRKSIAEISREEGISSATLYAWRKAARAEGQLLPDSDDTPEGWSAADKFNAVLETAALSETQLSEYCRRQGLYAAQITRWREACERANDWSATENAQVAKQKRGDRDRIRELERDLSRKEKALAEAAALLILQKKVRALWGEEER
jgi:transposase-like protein